MREALFYNMRASDCLSGWDGGVLRPVISTAVNISTSVLIILTRCHSVPRTSLRSSSIMLTRTQTGGNICMHFSIFSQFLNMAYHNDQTVCVKMFC